MAWDSEGTALRYGSITRSLPSAAEPEDADAKRQAERDRAAQIKRDRSARRMARRAGAEPYPVPIGIVMPERGRGWEVIHRGLYVQTVPPRFCYDNQWRMVAPAAARILATLVDAASNGREYAELWEFPCVGRSLDSLIYFLRAKLPPSVTIVNFRSLGYGITIEKRPLPMDIKQRAAGLADKMPEGCVAVALVAIGPDGNPVVITPPRTSPIGLVRMFGLAQIAVADAFEQVPLAPNATAPAPAVDAAAEDAATQAAIDAKRDETKPKYDGREPPFPEENES